MGIMLVYDVTNDKSFENIKNWIRNIEENASADVEKMLLGNKCELTDKRQVTKERGEQLAVEYGIKFMETSAKSSINVEEAFYTLARDIKAKMEKKLVRKHVSYHTYFNEIIDIDCLNRLFCIYYQCSYFLCNWYFIISISTYKTFHIWKSIGINN